MISFDDAIEYIRTIARPLGTERVRIDAAAGRVLATPVFAEIDSPRFDSSSMDGYAVRGRDLVPSPARLRVVGEAFPGSPRDRPLQAGECVRIFTGAPLPHGADRVVIQEDVKRDNDLAIFDREPGAQRYIRKRGSDFQTGDPLLGTGRLLDPRALVALAAADAGVVELFRVPRLFILSTGDELVEPGMAAGLADAVPDSASLGVAALAEQWGANCIGRQRLRDDPPSMTAAAAAAAGEADVIVVTGGASVGAKDFAKAMFEPLGLELIFSKVAMRPGKPAWLGRVQDALVVGLPGNPTSALVTARLFLAPLLAGLSGRPVDAALRWRSLELKSGLGPCDLRETFHRARCSADTAEILPNQDSGAQRVLADADLLVRQAPGSPALAAATIVQALDF